jgi:hypothetical protein
MRQKKQQATPERRTSGSNASILVRAACCLLFAVYCLLRIDTQIPHQKRIDVRSLLDRLGRATGAVA